MSKSHRRFGKYKDLMDSIILACDKLEAYCVDHKRDDLKAAYATQIARSIKYEIEQIYKTTTPKAP
jgi:hypothetical protein